MSRISDLSRAVKFPTVEPDHPSPLILLQRGRIVRIGPHTGGTLEKLLRSMARDLGLVVDELHQCLNAVVFRAVQGNPMGGRSLGEDLRMMRGRSAPPQDAYIRSLPPMGEIRRPSPGVLRLL